MGFDQKWRDKGSDLLVQALLSLENEEQAYRFLEDICTVSEARALVQRMVVASLLERGQTYSEIAAQTGASTATISRVNRCRQYGAGGYTHVLNSLKELDYEA